MLIVSDNRTETLCDRGAHTRKLTPPAIGSAPIARKRRQTLGAESLAKLVTRLRAADVILLISNAKIPLSVLVNSGFMRKELRAPRAERARFAKVDLQSHEINRGARRVGTSENPLARLREEHGPLARNGELSKRQARHFRISPE